MFVTPVKTGIQENTACRIKSGMKRLVSFVVCVVIRKETT
jgi:hypothetical protein